MTAAKASRNVRIRERRSRSRSLAELAREFGTSKTNIVRILDETGGDPLRPPGDHDLSRANDAELDREEVRLCDRIRFDLQRLIAVREERDVRRTDRILGLTT